MKQVNIHDLELPVDFRSESVQKIFRMVRLAESGILVGPAGMGKTLTLELLTNQDVQKFHLPEFKIAVFHFDLAEADIEEISSRLGEFMEIDSQTRLLIVGDNAEILEGSKGKDIIQKLKSAREKHRSQTSILLSSERNVLQAAAFSENSSLKSILTENVFTLLPLNEKDSQSFAQAIAKQYGFKIPGKLLTQIVAQSGGAPRIIKRLVKLAQDSEIFESVVKSPHSDAKMSFDLKSLSDYCQVHPDYEISIPLLPPPPKQHDSIMEIDFASPLTRQEFALAKALIESRNTLVGREAMIKAVWPKNLYETSEHALDQMLHRLRKKLESATPKCSLLTYRGRGAKLLLS